SALGPVQTDALDISTTSFTHLPQTTTCISFFTSTSTTAFYTLSLHDALPICLSKWCLPRHVVLPSRCLEDSSGHAAAAPKTIRRSEEHTSELQSRVDLVCRLLLEKKKIESHKLQDITHIICRIADFNHHKPDR